MSRKEDIVFCKIALTNGLITQEAAQKALALCDRKEKETGRRPLIGALFTKHNLMNNQEVKRIYTAVQRRLGTTVGPQISASRGRGGRKGKKGRGGGRTQGHESRFDRRGKPTRPIDPKTLYMGIGGLVVFLGIMVVLIVMVVAPSGESPEESGAGGAVSGQTPGATPGTTGGGGSRATAGGGAPGAGARTPAGGALPDRVKSILDQKIADARSEKGTKAREYLDRLTKDQKELATKGYAPYPRLDAMIKELQEAVAAEGEASPGEGSTEQPPASGEGTGGTAAGTEKPEKATQPAQPAAAKPPGGGAEDDLMGEL